MTAPAPPRATYWRLWTDADGISRQSRCEMTQFDLNSIGPPAEPQWLGVKSHHDATIFVTILPVGWIGEWHENPKPQWIIPLSGRWFVESMDGQKVELGAGDLSFGGDQGSIERDGRVGHRSGTVGGEPAVLMIVQIEAGALPDPPCGFG